MTRRFVTDITPDQPTLRRAFVLFSVMAVIASAFWAAKVTQAEFEVPLVDTTDFVPTEFRSIYAYNRQTVDAGSTFSNYEGFAVGQPVQAEQGTTAIYKFKGDLWEKILPQGVKTMAGEYQLNAVGGEYFNLNGYSSINFVGRQVSPDTTRKRQAYIVTLMNYPRTLGSYQNNPTSVGQVILNNYTQRDNPSVAFFRNLSTNLPFEDDAYAAKIPPDQIPANSELYAIGMSPVYQRNVDYGHRDGNLAGGQNGWLATIWRRFGPSSTCYSNFIGNSATTCTGTNKEWQESWYLYRFSDSAGPNVPFANTAGTATPTDNITGIVHVNENTAYVTTSTFPQVSVSDTQQKSPFARDCSGAQTSKLFRIIGDVTKATSWTRVNVTANECFYGLTATLRDQASVNGGPLITDIWIASSNGIRRIIDDGTNASSLVWNNAVDAPAEFRNLPAYGITSSFERSGNGQQLLLNGNMDAWTLNLVGANQTNPQNKPAGWQFNGLDPYGNWGIAVDGSCGVGLRDVMPVNRGGGNWGVKIEPGLQHFSLGACPAAALRAAYRDRYVGVHQTVPLSGTEGTRYRISGSYKVTYTTSAAWPAGYTPTYRQAGVMTTCLGANRKYLSQQTSPPYTVNCSLTNKQEMRTVSGPGDSMATYTDFSYIVSRANNQFATIGKAGPAASPSAAEESLYLVIECVASYGTAIECDNLKVEELSDPILPARSVVSVLAVGKDGLTLRNDNANGVSPAPTTWAIDDASLLVQPAGSRVNLNAVTNAGGAHIYAAGSNTSLLQRSIGNISGFIWLGGAQPLTTNAAGVTTSVGAIGWAAMNCANLRDASLRTLCQQQAQSFGLSLEKNSATGFITLGGRAWLGKQLTSSGANDNEGLNLGTCEKPARRSSLPAGQPYNMTGSCNLTTRTCVADTSLVCITDFDCYGRCANDKGYICLSNNDCNAAKTTPPLPSLTNSPLDGVPSYNLSCDGGVASSPNACSAAGWLTFNANDLPGANIPPSAPGFGVTLNQTTGGLNGWARFMTLANADSTNYQLDQGWVKFRGVPSNPVGTKIYAGQNCQGPYVLRCSNNPGNSCVVGSESVSCGNAAAKCVNYSTCAFGYDQSLQSCHPPANTCTNFCGGNIAQPCTSDAECSSLWNSTESCKPIGYCSTTSGTPATPCTTNAQCASGSFCMFGALCNVGGASSCNVYGVDYDESKGKFQGFAWSAEYGWVDFRAAQKGTNRFLQTRLGDIYSGGNIGSPTIASTAQCNATYLISAVGTISNFCTNLTDTGLSNFLPEQNLVTPIPFSSGSNAFTNALGRFDLTGIETVNTGVNPSCPTAVGANKYCQTITTITPYSADGSYSLTYTGGPLDGANQIALNNTVYTANCAGSPGNTCKLTQALRIRNADPGNNGGGILVVNGNLTITNNLQYVSSSIDDLRRLASLVIVVRGNLNIENQVSTLVGAYYVDGTVYTTPDADKDKPENRFPLTVRGLMMAKNFAFNRKFAGTVESPLPSELFIFDGRLQSNPLPGMVDFASALPNTFNSSP